MEAETDLQLKICGITQLEDARYAVAAGATHLGFVQDSRSDRYVSAEKAREIIEWVYGAVPVGVFVDAEIEAVETAVDVARFQMVQLHGSETPEYCKALDVPLIKAVSIDEETTSEKVQSIVEAYSPVVQWMMFDTSRSSSERKAFNWNLLNDITRKKPFFLAGGITVFNVEEALETVHPDGIDVSSGLESSPGIKDFDKIDEFMRKIEDRLQ